VFISVLCVSIKCVDHGGRQGNMVQALDQWWHPLASSEALDVLHREICPTSHRCIAMAIKLFVRPPLTMDADSATICDGGQAICRKYE
jgi:hypothetical protein